jgi:hypothetical protein
MCFEWIRSIRWKTDPVEKEFYTKLLQKWPDFDDEAAFEGSSMSEFLHMNANEQQEFVDILKYMCENLQNSGIGGQLVLRSANEVI